MICTSLLSLVPWPTAVELSTWNEAAPQAPPKVASNQVDGLPLFGGSLKVRQSKADKNLVEKPALAQLTDNAGTGTVAAIDAAVIWETGAPPKGLESLQFSAELHKNDDPKKKQDVFLGGASVSDIWDFGAVTLAPRLGLDFKRDVVRDSEGISSSLVVPLVVPAAYLSYYYAIDSKKEWLLAPGAAIRFDFEDVIHSKSNSDEGEVLRGGISVECMLANVKWRAGGNPGPDFDRRTSLTVEGLLLTDLHEWGRIDDGDDDHALFRATLTQALDQDSHVGLTLRYVNGEDPSIGLNDAEYVQFGVSIQF